MVDAFTSERFGGNPAAVVPVQHWPSDGWMERVAAENNLSETAFVRRLEGEGSSEQHFQIRWFSPVREIEFCGHATLAAAFVLFHEFGIKGPLTFDGQIGRLSVSQGAGGRIEMDFPARPPVALEPDGVPPALLRGLSAEPAEVLRSPQAYFAVYRTAAQVRELEYDAAELSTLGPLDVVATAPGDGGADVVSRYFWPASSGANSEDPVTGSIHAGLTPYWAGVLGRGELRCEQVSPRGGVLHCTLRGERVGVSGHGVLYLRGEIADEDGLWDATSPRPVPPAP